MDEDKGLTTIQAYLRAEARKARHLFCAVCRIEPPVQPGGPCASCYAELGMG